MEIQFAKQRIIKDIRNDDLRIQITGYVKELAKNDNFILNDKTGEIKINFKESEFDINNDDLVNVIGTLTINMEGGKTIEADIIQDMTNLNFKYYQKLYELKLELEKE
jgi:uncharacterized protein YdeI (BOF family)